MIYKYSSPPLKVALTSPRKVTHLPSRSPRNSEYETKITSTKKIVIEGDFDPFQPKSNRTTITLTNSEYFPEQNRQKMQVLNSQFKRTNSRIVGNDGSKSSNKESVSSNRGSISSKNGSNSSNKENMLRSKDKIESSSSINVVSSGRKFAAPSLFTTKDDIYEGEYNERGFFEGKGRYYFKGCNVIYDGEFEDGEIHGFGKLYYEYPENGRFPVIYQGGFKHAKKHGTGIYYYGDKNHYYQGEWVNDIKEGKGYYESPEERYNGSWAKNKRHGDGQLINNRTQTQFNGKFYDDFFTQGEILYPNGDVYLGSFHLGKKEGYGTYTYKGRNQQYEGQFSNDLRHGKGTLKMANGDQYTGSFRHGRIDESMNCQYKWANGNVFNGWFKNSQPEKGTIKDVEEEIEYEYTAKTTASFIVYE